MTLLLAIQPSGGNWSPAAWSARFATHYSGRVIVAGRDTYDPADVRYVAAWKPEPGFIARHPKLDVIFNLGAGVDALLQDATLPAVPIVRVVDPNLTRRMTEYVIWQVLDLHRQGPVLRTAQAERQWNGPVQRAASDVRVGIMGLGAIARDAAEVLLRLGFKVSAWSRSGRSMPGVTAFSGDHLDAFLAGTDILVCLLPLTPDTTAILDARLLTRLPAGRDNASLPALINAGRGGHQVATDIVAALDRGTLGHAVLDVFETEPLPPTSPLWRHPKVTITPHNAADSDPDAISRYVVEQIRAHARGDSLHNVVDRARGY